MSVALTPPTSNSSPQGGGGQRTAVPTLVTAPWSWDEAPVCSLFVLDNDPSLGYPSSRSATLPSRGAGEPDRRSRRASCPMRESRPTARTAARPSGPRTGARAGRRNAKNATDRDAGGRHRRRISLPILAPRRRPALAARDAGSPATLPHFFEPATGVPLLASLALGPARAARSARRAAMSQDQDLGVSRPAINDG